MNKPSKRVWTIEPDPHTGLADERAFHSLMSDVAVIVEKVGGVVAVSSARIPLEIPGVDGVYGTARYIVTWQSFAPAARPAQQPERRPEPVSSPPEPETEIEAEVEAMDDEEVAAPAG